MTPKLPHYDDIPESLRTIPQGRYPGWHYVLFSGNPPLSPHVYGWILRLNRYATDAEKAWLKAKGFTFRGGKWCRADTPTP